MHYTTIILSFFISAATAAPTTTTTSSTTPAYMTLAQCKASIDATGAKKTLFWSGCGNKAKAATADTTNYSYLQGYKVIRDLFTTKTFVTDYTAKFAKESATIQEAADNALWNSCSQAVANLAEGEVYVMLPGGSDKSTGLDWGNRAKSHWAEHEYPILCRKETVTHLYRLSATDNKVKEDLTEDMLAQRKAGTCPALVSITADVGGETAT